MTQALAIEIFRQALLTTFWLSLPLLALGFVVGILVSLVQILTSMQDASFGAVPRLLTFLFGLLLCLPWMTTKMMSYTTTLLGDFHKYAR